MAAAPGAGRCSWGVKSVMIALNRLIHARLSYPGRIRGALCPCGPTASQAHHRRVWMTGCPSRSGDGPAQERPPFGRSPLRQENRTYVLSRQGAPRNGAPHGLTAAGPKVPSQGAMNDGRLKTGRAAGIARRWAVSCTGREKTRRSTRNRGIRPSKRGCISRSCAAADARTGRRHDVLLKRSRWGATLHQ